MKDIELSKIFDSMKANDISEVIIKDGGKLYEIRRGGFKQTQAPVVQMPGLPVMNQAQPVIQQAQMNAVSTSAEQPVQTKAGKDTSSNYHEIKSPLVGTFYSSPKPDAPSFVEVGSKVTKGQKICIVEAMKTFNEIECDVDGIIREVCMKNGDLVEFGKVLFKVEV
jgi:acetyl-CoA carboxylase biotin carboxyl carrier protein